MSRVPVMIKLSQIHEIVKKYIDEYNNGNTNDEKIDVNWHYWLANAIYSEVTNDYAYSQSWRVYRIVSKDGLVLEVYSNDHGMFIRIGSLHKNDCYCGD